MKTILMMAVTLAAAPLAAQSAVPAGGPPPAVEIPATPAGAAARGLMDAVNAPDDAAVRDWVRRTLPERGAMGWTPERWEAAFLKLRAQSGGVSPARLMDRGDPGYLGVIFRARNGAGRVGIEFSADADGRVTSVDLHAMPAPGPRPELPTEPMADDSVAWAVRAHVDRLAAADRFSGVILLARGDRVLMHQAYGMADAQAGRPNTVETRIGSGSVPKMITAAAVAQLVEQGRIRLDDTLGALLPDFPNAEARRTVTVRHLLTHAGGIADPFLAGADPSVRRRTPAEWVALIADRPLDFAPGTRTQYSNGGFAVLAAIVERVSGQTFDAYVREHVFRRAGMRAADAAGYAALPWARGYSRVPEFDPMSIEPRRSNEWITGGRGPGEDLSGFGGIALTAEDLFRFSRALRDGRLVRPETARTFMTGTVPVEPGMPLHYGLGFYDMTLEGGAHAVGHSGGGGNSGIGADVEMVGEWTLVVMGNYDLEQDIRPLVWPVLDLLGAQEGSRDWR
ncbi:serine hydrolase domain-containing protein [Longimicrobium sp.]|uniref:serine hydrolase domain-containing protein n=1 Tax=Longimicrobium sp. TaxID=2029185 RepID=UPI002E337CB9|nr:serine hydrolase domain-containing protein [Longimicrobium sp.]HEX6036955.1 serine hydrolase domain-containing protein [Longimicrobium sp.]